MVTEETLHKVCRKIYAQQQNQSVSDSFHFCLDWSLSWFNNVYKWDEISQYYKWDETNSNQIFAVHLGVGYAASTAFPGLSFMQTEQSDALTRIYKLKARFSETNKQTNKNSEDSCREILAGEIGLYEPTLKTLNSSICPGAN